MNYQVKDSGNRREFGTGAVRDMGEGKGRTDLLPFFSLLEVSKHMEAGAAKYGDENWRKGIPLRTYLDSAVRHLFKFALGMRDERHDLAAAWNVLCLIETQNMIDRGILPPVLGNLPDWWDAHPEPAGPTLAEAVSDFRPVEELDAYLSERFPQAGPIQRANGAQRDALAELLPTYQRDVEVDGTSFGGHYTVPVLHPTINLREQDHYPPSTQSLARLVRMEPGFDTASPKLQETVNAIHADEMQEFVERQARRLWDRVAPKPTPELLREAYTRGHADDTAARFNAGLPYRDGADQHEALMWGEVGPKDYPQAADVQAAADADVAEGEYAPLPSPGEIVEAVMHQAAESIGGHPLFGVTIIDGPDAAEYDGPEVCGIKPDTCGCYGSPPADPNPLDGVPFAVLRKPEPDDERRWVVQAGIVYYAPDTHTEFRESRLTLDTIRSMVAVGNLAIDQIGRGR